MNYNIALAINRGIWLIQSGILVKVLRIIKIIKIIKTLNKYDF
jgi:hypothetical protein